MDFPTRNLYRSAIEELAQGARRSELDVARAAVLAAGGPVVDGRSRRPAFRPRLLPGRRGAAELRGGDRLSSAGPRLAAPHLPVARHRRLRRGRRNHRDRHPGRSARRPGARRSRLAVAPRPRLARRRAGGRPQRRARQPRGDARLSRHRRARPGAEAGRASGCTHAGRGADATHLDRSGAAQRRGPGNPPPGESSPATCTSRCSPTGPTPTANRSMATKRWWRRRARG